jgi:hypothetical protein
MPIVLKAGGTAHSVSASSFGSEDELQRLLAERPELLRQESEPNLALIKREVQLGEAGALDLLLLRSDGLPVAVEVKLQRNGESRRVVVAQAIDYITALTDKTVDELDLETGGQVAEAIRAFTKDDEEAFDRTWTSLAANLRAGLARLIVAVDGSVPGLERMLRFLAEKSELDVQLFIVERFRSAENFEIAVARPTFSQASVSRSAISNDNTDLLESVRIYNDSADPQLKAVGIAQHYRQIRPPKWPPGSRTHYEFYQTQSYIGAELHIESDQARPMADVLSPLNGMTLPQAGKQLLWDPQWSSGRGRLTARFARGGDAATIALAMKELIDATYAPVTDRFALLGKHSAVGLPASGQLAPTPQTPP